MDFEFMKDLMGDSYKEGITLDEVKTFMDGKKFADLSTGNYVDKNKYTNEINTLKSKLNTTETELKNKMTDDEKLAQSQKDKDAEIERLQKLYNESIITGNKNTVISELSNSRDILGINVNDKDFREFVDNITVEDSVKTNTVAQYVSKIVKDAYEKGKKDATKDAMGDFGKGKGKGNASSSDAVGELGKRLASSTKKSTKFDYFK